MDLHPVTNKCVIAQLFIVLQKNKNRSFSGFLIMQRRGSEAASLMTAENIFSSTAEPPRSLLGSAYLQQLTQKNVFLKGSCSQEMEHLYKTCTRLCSVWFLFLTITSQPRKPSTFHGLDPRAIRRLSESNSGTSVVALRPWELIKIFRPPSVLALLSVAKSKSHSSDNLGERGVGRSDCSRTKEGLITARRGKLCSRGTRREIGNFVGQSAGLHGGKSGSVLLLSFLPPGLCSGTRRLCDTCVLTSSKHVSCAVGSPSVVFVAPLCAYRGRAPLEVFSTWFWGFIWKVH